jgi:hypothetical protein
MRIEYELYQKLVWNPAFRRSIAESSPEDLMFTVPDCTYGEAIVKLARSPGLEEEAYRRIAALHRISSEIFVNSHPLFLTYFGDAFFEQVLASYFSDTSSNKDSIEILEPFDGYVAGPRLLRAATETAPKHQLEWLSGLAVYDWAVWHAARVADGWPPIANRPPLVPGASLISVQFDLPSLLIEVKRLQRSEVSYELFRERIRPAPGSYYAVILPKNGTVLQAKVNAETFAELQSSTQQGAVALQPNLRCLVQDLGIVVANSFLCCSSEFRNSIKTIPEVIFPEPH